MADLAGILEHLTGGQMFYNDSCAVIQAMKRISLHSSKKSLAVQAEDANGNQRSASVIFCCIPLHIMIQKPFLLLLFRRKKEYSDP